MYQNFAELAAQIKELILADAYARLVKILKGRKAAGRIIHDETGEFIVRRGDDYAEELVKTIPFKYWERIQIESDHAVQDAIFALVDGTTAKLDIFRKEGEPLKDFLYRFAHEADPQVTSVVVNYPRKPKL